MRPLLFAACLLGCHHDTVVPHDAGPSSCAEVTCPDHVLCGGTDGGFACLSQCAMGFDWDAASASCKMNGSNCTDGDPKSILSMCSSLHRACVPGSDGATCGVCRADSGGCWVGPAAEAAGACRAPTTCASCGAHRDCVMPPGCGDVACGACVASFVDDGSGACRPAQAQGDCVAAHRDFVAVGAAGYCGDCSSGYIEYAGRCALPTCDGTPGSLAALCADFKRGCSDGPPPTCAPCGAGTMLAADGFSCVPSGPCSRETDCPAGLSCIQLKTNDDPQCRPAPCPQGQVWDRVSQACKGCSCVGGAPWPVTNRDGSCYCAGPPGTYYNRPRLQILACDADGDAWLSKEVQDTLSEATGSTLDYTVLLNVRCPITVAGEVWLQNEWGQMHQLSLQDDLRLSGTTTALPLFEHPDNDNGANPYLAQVPGGPLSAASVNSLTKICADAPSDMNRNGQFDLDEDQGQTLLPEQAWAQPYQRLTHFAEEYQVSFIKMADAVGVAPCVGCTNLPIASAIGRLVISERRRCASFPFQYAESDGWWKSCTRRRDGAFQGNTLLGYDFAGYDCDAVNGACSYDWRPLWSPVIPNPQDPNYPNPPPEALPPPLTALPRLRNVPHGVCDGSVPPTDPWRGMTHYSQFVCAKMVSSGAGKRNQIVAADVATSLPPAGIWEAQRCALAGETSSSLPGKVPNFACSVDVSGTVRAGRVGWFARRFFPYDPDPKKAGGYKGGCIDEGTEWNLMCPGDRALAIGSRTGFGRLICGPPCPSQEAFYTDKYWICGHTTASAFIDGTLAYSAAPYSLSGEVPVSGADGQLMSSGSCDGGSGCYTLR